MTVQGLRSVFFNNPDLRVNVDNKLRKEVLLSNDISITINGKLRKIKFQTIGGGVYEAYLTEF
jgi:hypothetical protein